MVETHELHSRLTAIRRRIHANPEAGFEERATAALVAATLREHGIEVHEGIAGTGVVGVIRGERAGQRSIALRADMDALPITEQNRVDHCSRIPGRMHACGHDGHTTMLLGAAMELSRTRDFAGRVVLVFQPAEENLAGARAMVRDGLLERFAFDAVYGLHVRPGFPAGHLCMREGPMFAASDSWQVDFHGSGGHGGSSPHLSTDPTVPLGHFLVGLHTIVARNVPALEAAVVSVGHVHAGDEAAPNVIPALARVVGTARSYLPEVRKTLETRLRKLATSFAEAHQCRAEVQYRQGYPAVVNTPREARIARMAAIAAAGEQAVDATMAPRTASDDFAYYLQHRPGAFAMIGNGFAADGSWHGVHTPLFDFNDAVLLQGVRYWQQVVRHELGGASGGQSA